jgi:hypothetical protein
MLAEEFGRDVRTSLWRAAEVLAAQHEYIKECVPLKGDTLPVTALRHLPEALQRQTILTWLRHHHIPQVSFTLVEQIRAMLPPGAPVAKVNLPGGSHARRRTGLLFISPQS